jgi:hypothetical protein
MLLFTLLFAAQMVGIWLGDALLAGRPDANPWLVGALENAVPLALFLLAMRALPLAGTHAAEHQVVHAIERGEELDARIVSRMPRVHPRCGTNVAAGASLFLGIAMTPWTPYLELRLLAAALVTLTMWRRLGSWIQLNVTTKPPSAQQLMGGIAAGHQLLERFARVRVGYPTLGMRIWNSGMLHVMAGSLLVFGFVQLLSRLLGVDLGI